MRYIICLIFIASLGATCLSQNYTRDAGVRFGKGIFISYRQFYDEERAIEGFIGYSQRAFRISGFREFFRPLAPVRSENLRMVYGYGVHAGVSYSNKYQIFNRVYIHNWQWSPQFGVDGIIGAEYTASEFPVMVSAAIQPFFEYSLNNYFSVQPFNFIIVFKYRF
jgi:hypothetical protein